MDDITSLYKNNDVKPKTIALEKFHIDRKEKS
jgi:hypothetical protein